MTSAERTAYAAAMEPWKRRAEREGHKISHVIWRNSHAEVTLEPRPLELPWRKDQPLQDRLL